jgi:ribosomal protein RSM22 (predicted rRNA methylase)
MRLPTSLQAAVEQENARAGIKPLMQAAAELSDRYRSPRNTPERFITTEAHRLAYVAVRMPATFAAVRAALAETQRLVPELQIESLLDLGAGTGAASWAAAEVFDQLREFTLVEQDRLMIELGQRLAQASDNKALRSADWRLANLKTTIEFAPHDLVVCSYSLNEIDPAAARRILDAAWRATRQVLVLVEPGTMKGFEVIRAARAQLIEAGAFIAAPCPHAQACPMLAPNVPHPNVATQSSESDWCHFAARFERSSLHRRLKGGTLGYEDEKFTYIAVTRQAVEPAAARVLRHPLRQSGHTRLQLCTATGLRTVTITKRDKSAWKQARKTNWGDAWDNALANDPD